MANFFEKHASDVVKFSLLDFEGPIELLYTLIVVEGKYDLLTFPLAQITSQYMQYMEDVGQLDMDVASDFVSVAATLLEIKSKDALPKEEIEDEEYIEEEDPEELLRRRLLMYAMFKEKGEALKGRETLNKFYRKPVFTDKDAIIVLSNFDLNNLIDAYGRMLLRLNEKEIAFATKKIVKDPYTVADKINYIAKRVVEQKSIKSSELFGEKVEKSEKISTFQALLELMKKQIVKATQESFNDDILIQYNEEIDSESIDYSHLSDTEE